MRYLLSISLAVLVNGCSSDLGDGNEPLDGLAPDAAPVVMVDAGPADGDGGASSDAGSGGVDAGGGSADAYALCVNMINGFRTGAGLDAVTRWTEKESCIDGQAKADAEADQAGSAFQQCEEQGQNYCKTTGVTLSEDAVRNCLQSQWDAGAGGPYDNIANAEYKLASCGTFKAADGSWWMLTNFTR